MIFLDYGKIGEYAIILGMLVAGTWAFRCVRSKRKSIRVAVRVVSIAVIGLSSLLTVILLMLESFGSTTWSPPIYSPDHKRAIRIADYDEGALGGDTAVELYSNRGLLSETVFYGSWDTVKPEDVHWDDNSNVTISYAVDARDADCSGSKSIQVHCERIAPYRH